MRFTLLFFALVASMALAGCSSISKNMPKYNSMLIIGDNLTAHLPDPSLNWPNDWGMAASSQDKDYAHILYSKLKSHSPDIKLKLDSIIYQDEMAGWVHLFPTGADLIIIQLSENYDGGISLAEYGLAYEELIKELKSEFGEPLPCTGTTSQEAKRTHTIVCVGPWNKTQLEPVIEQAAQNQGVRYVSLKAIHADLSNHASSQKLYPKLGNMPSDNGMKNIAKAIIKNLEN